MPYPPSNFEALVGSFLQSYTAMRASRRADAESDIRDRQAKRADQLQRIQMDEAGYDEIAMPKIGPPPDQGFFGKVGQFLSGGPDQPGPIVMKTHQSTREREQIDARAAHLADVSEQERYGLELEGIRAANARKLEAERQAGDMARTVANNRTQLQVAGIQKQPNLQDATKDDLAIKHQVINDAIDATGGHAQEAYDQLPADVKRKYRIGANDMNAGVERWRNSRAMLTRETIQSREDIAAQKNATKDAIRQRLLGGGGSVARGGGAAAVDPATMSNADAWEYYVKQGMTPEQATAKVQSRGRP
jgi:hypothetical protein